MYMIQVSKHFHEKTMEWTTYANSYFCKCILKLESDIIIMNLYHCNKHLVLAFDEQKRVFNIFKNT